jgi:hypothetical protein
MKLSLVRLNILLFLACITNAAARKAQKKKGGKPSYPKKIKSPILKVKKTKSPNSNVKKTQDTHFSKK